MSCGWSGSGVDKKTKTCEVMSSPWGQAKEYVHKLAPFIFSMSNSILSIHGRLKILIKL
jgi:hypothetical protein